MQQPFNLTLLYLLKKRWTIEEQTTENEDDYTYETYLSLCVPDENKKRFGKIFGICHTNLHRLPTRYRKIYSSDKLQEVLEWDKPGIAIHALWAGARGGSGVYLSGPIKGKKISDVFVTEGDAIAIIKDGKEIYGMLWPHANEYGILTRTRVR